MRIGVMVGAPSGDVVQKAAGLVADAQWAEQAGLDTVWVPQVPNDFDALTAATLIAAATVRIEVGTSVVPLQPQHPVALARQVLSLQGVATGRFSLGVGPSHHWVISDMLGMPYDRPVEYTRDYLEVLVAAFSGAPSIDVVNRTFTVHNPFVLGQDEGISVLLAALGPRMLELAGECSDGTILWMADERAISDHVVPRLAKSAANGGRPSPRVVAGIPMCLCAKGDVPKARERAEAVLGEARVSPNYQRLLTFGDAASIGDICLAGDEAAIRAGCERFAAAGATDLAVRLLPIGDTRAELEASKRRTREFLGTLRFESNVNG